MMANKQLNISPADFYSRDLGIKIPNRNGWVEAGRCHMHNDRTPGSFYVHTGHGGFICHSCGAKGGGIVDFVMMSYNLDFKDALNRLSSDIPISPVRPASYQAQPKKDDTKLDGSPKMDTVWNKRIPLAGTVGETYFTATRKCAMPNCDDVAFLPADDYSEYPAIISRITDAITGKPITLHFTYLKPDGSGKAPIKKPKQWLYGHRKLGGVIRLIDEAYVTTGLGIAEGLENALTCIKMGFYPVWAAGDAGNIAAFPVLSGIEALTILADHGVAGMNAANECADRWRSAGREVRIIAPDDPNADWNDLMVGRSA